MKHLLTLLLLVAPLSFASAQTTAVLAEGAFVKKAVKTQGRFQIVRVGEDLRLELNEDFSTSRAPDLQLFLVATATEAAKAEDASGAGVFYVAHLENRKGAQSYDLPDDLDLSAYRTVLLHCVQYSKLFAAAPLNPPAAPAQ